METKNFNIEEGRKVLGRTFEMKYAGMTFYYKPTNLLNDMSTTEERYVFFALMAIMNEKGDITEKGLVELYDAQTFLAEIKDGKLIQTNK